MGELFTRKKGLLRYILESRKNNRKKYARKMEFLDKVRDGSEDAIGRGYWLLKVIATEVEGERMVPLVGKLYSALAPGHVRENREILEVMDMVADAVNKRGIWVMDRGGDRRNLIEPMLQKGYRFLIRLRGDRHLIWDRRAVLASEIAKECPCGYAETIVKVDDGREKVYHVEFGFRKVSFPGRIYQNQPRFIQQPTLFLADP